MGFLLPDQFERGFSLLTSCFHTWCQFRLSSGSLSFFSRPQLDFCFQSPFFNIIITGSMYYVSNPDVSLSKEVSFLSLLDLTQPIRTPAPIAAELKEKLHPSKLLSPTHPPSRQSQPFSLSNVTLSQPLGRFHQLDNVDELFACHHREGDNGENPGHGGVHLVCSGCVVSGRRIEGLLEIRKIEV